MREILFRGKRKDNGEWVAGNLISFTGSQFTAIFSNPSFSCTVDPSTVGQYTGLTDRNNKMIFEGDILRCVDNYETYITSVYYTENTPCVDIHIGVDIPECDNYTAIGFAEDIWKNQNCEVEVIGNIYDNPELLKGGKENG